MEDVQSVLNIFFEHQVPAQSILLTFLSRDFKKVKRR